MAGHATGDNSRTRTWLKPEQVKRLRDECLTDTCPTYLQDRDKAIIILAYDTGLRAGELVVLDVDHVDLEVGTVFLLSAIQKIFIRKRDHVFSLLERPLIILRDLPTTPVKTNRRRHSRK